jgi:3-deoxy-D-manno-octulosonic-acid transferase
MIRRGKWQAHWRERLGRYHTLQQHHAWNEPVIWVRSISVGETLVALKILNALIARLSNARFVLSVTTSTGRQLAEEALSALPRTDVIYNPLDADGMVHRALAAVRPALIVLVEGELWPNFLAAAWARKIPVVLANARLSPRSASRHARFRWFSAPWIRLLRRITVPTTADRDLWIALGASAESVVVTGSVKFDSAGSLNPEKTAQFDNLLRASGVQGPVVIAGSTFPGEETLLATCFRAWRSVFPGLLLLIAPRHVERIPEIARELGDLGFAPVLRSALPASAAAEHGLVLLDTTGELRDWYALAHVVFIGKSITAEGGQNPAEPALVGRPVLFGPRMENFRGTADALLAAGGAVEVHDAATMEHTVLALLQDRARAQGMGERAQSVFTPHTGATTRTIAAIEEATK